MTEPQDPFRQGLSFAARLGLELVVATVVGAFLGYLLDQRLDSRPWGMVAGLLLGAMAGFRNVYRIANPETPSDEKNEKDS